MVWLRAFFAIFLFSIFVPTNPAYSKNGAPPGVDHAAQGGQIGGVFESCTLGGDPVGQAGILVYIPGRSFSARTGPAGDFLLNYVPAGIWTLVFERRGEIIHIEEDVPVGIRESTDLGIITLCPDLDNDGFDQSLDCDDRNAAINPEATEICNGVDDDCNGEVDEAEVCRECDDSDRDGFFAQDGCGTPVDCDDRNRAVNPGAEETCFDGIDNNCNGEVDEDCALCDVGAPCDTGLPGQCAVGAFDPTCQCVPINRPDPEVCDNLDNDCDGRIDEDLEQVCGSDVGECRTGIRVCDRGQFSICIGEVGPTPELCDGLDNDCDGVADENFDLGSDPNNCGACGRTCGLGELCQSGICQPEGPTEDSDGDGVPDVLDSNPDNPFVCQDLDGDSCDDCSAGAGANPFNDGVDNDSDGFCSVGDCDDTDINNFPGNEEICGDQRDNNCDGRADEQCQTACDQPNVLCADVCTDIGSDPLNCGDCGRSCLTGESCQNSVCVAP
jgi:hypothetical protein